LPGFGEFGFINKGEEYDLMLSNISGLICLYFYKKHKKNLYFILDILLGSS